jgi:hypothetical protein
MAERMDHEKMRRAAQLPVQGPAATDNLAASGGLELPGRAAEGVTPDQQHDLEEARREVAPTVASLEKQEQSKETE